MPPITWHISAGLQPRSRAQTKTARTIPLERSQAHHWNFGRLLGLFRSLWSGEFGENMWWKEPEVWHMTQWLRGSELLLLLHRVFGLLGVGWGGGAGGSSRGELDGASAGGGGIALARLPAPALEICPSARTHGRVSGTLSPRRALPAQQ